MRVAAIDIGTNTVLLLVADREQNGSLVAVAERATITRLGAGVDRERKLAPEAVKRTCDCLRGYGALVGELGAQRIVVVGTSAMRDAAGGAVVASCVQRAFGTEARVLTGEEEARLTFAGATSGLHLQEREEVAVFDIGGGSTEIALGRIAGGGPALSYAQSFDIGSVRFTERHVAHDPPTPAELETLAKAARDALAGVPAIASTATAVGVAGTITTLAAVSLAIEPYDGARLHGARVTRAALRRVVDELSSLSLKDRRNVPGMHPMRADVIVAGGFIAIALLDHWETESILVSDRGVRWGLAEAIASSPA